MNWLELILAAGPVAPVVPAAPPADPLGPLYILVGSMVVLQLGAMIAGGVKWLAARTVEREDKDKEDLRARLDEHDEKFTKLERTLYDLDRLLGRLESDGKTHNSSVEGIRATIVEIKAAMETGRDKQAEAHRSQMKDMLATVNEKLEKLEYSIRQDTTRAIHDAKVLRDKG